MDSDAVVVQAREKFDSVKKRRDAERLIKEGLETMDAGALATALKYADELKAIQGDFLGASARAEAEKTLALAREEEEIIAELKQLINEGGCVGSVDALTCRVGSGAELLSAIEHLGTKSFNTKQAKDFIMAGTLLVSCYIASLSHQEHVAPRFGDMQL